ncbi:MAG: EamA family transporter [Desulfobacter sp.]|nr:MAG: EamA family transporter [Desulfobacter sp.]
MINEKYKGVFAALSANVIFGLNIPVTKSLVADWMTPMGYTITRMFFGTVIFWLIASLFKREQMEGRDLGIVLIGGLLGYFGTQFLFSKALEYTTPVIFALLIALTPVAALMLSAVFLKEPVSKRKIAGITLSISGAFLVILAGGSSGTGANNFLGILLTVLCVFFYAGYMVLTRQVATKYSPVTVAKWMFLISAAVLLPLSFSLDNQRIYTHEGTLLAFSLLGFALIFSTTLAFFFMPLALKKLEASTVSIFMNLQPLVASVVAIGIGQDTFTWDKIPAALLVLSGVYLVSVNRATSARHTQPVKLEAGLRAAFPKNREIV